MGGNARWADAEGQELDVSIVAIPASEPSLTFGVRIRVAAAGLQFLFSRGQGDGRRAAHFHRWGNHDLQTKLGLVAVVTALVVWHIRRPASHVLDGLIFLGRVA